MIRFTVGWGGLIGSSESQKDDFASVEPKEESFGNHTRGLLPTTTRTSR